MECVDPIKNLDEINVMKQVLRQHSQRDLLLFVFGINTGLRVSDLLSLRVDQVWDGKQNQAKEFIYIKAPNSDDLTAFYLNDRVKEELINYFSLQDNKEEDYLFKSKKSGKPITRQQAYRILNQAANEVGISGKIGTHTLRKTFGYHAYRKGIAISILMKMFHHQSSAETMRYLGIEKHEKRLVKVDVNL